MWQIIEKRIVFASNKKTLAQKWIRKNKKKYYEYELMEKYNGK